MSWKNVLVVSAFFFKFSNSISSIIKNQSRRQMRNSVGNTHLILNNETQAIFHVSSIQINFINYFPFEKCLYWMHTRRIHENRDIRTIMLIAINEMPLLYFYSIFSLNFRCFMLYICFMVGILYVCIFYAFTMHSEYEYIHSLAEFLIPKYK